ncbi:MAG TPA: siderophore-interacting protein [Candidatus Binatia bacterium]
MPQEFEAGRVCAARFLCPQIRNITIGSNALAGFVFEAGADVTIRLPPGGGSADECHYSVWKSTAQGEFEVCVVLHGLGPGSRWASQCAVGDPVEISRSHILPIALDRSTEAHLFFGDETSIASADAMMRALPADAVVFTGFEISSIERRWPDSEIFRPEAVHWIDRAGRVGSALVAWLANQSFPPAKSTTAYVTGEAWLCAMLHAHLVRERGFPARAVRAMPYWKSRSKLP